MKYTIERTGLPPLIFEGDLIAGDGASEPDGKRGYDICLYRTEAGSLVLAVWFSSKWEREADHSWAALGATLLQLEEQRLQWTVVPPTVGYPLGDRYAEKQSRLIATLKDAFNRALSEVYLRAGVGYEI
jgi:hypothetical protein